MEEYVLDLHDVIENQEAKIETLVSIIDSQADMIKKYQNQIDLMNGLLEEAKKTEDWPGSVQYFEVTPDKKLVWALSQWRDPDLGPGSSIQILDEPSIKKDK